MQSPIGGQAKFAEYTHWVILRQFTVFKVATEQRQEEREKDSYTPFEPHTHIGGDILQNS